MGVVAIWNMVKYEKGDVTAALSVLGIGLGKSRVCEIGRKVLCQIYAREYLWELWRGLK